MAARGKGAADGDAGDRDFVARRRAASTTSHESFRKRCANWVSSKAKTSLLSFAMLAVGCNKFPILLPS